MNGLLASGAPAPAGLVFEPPEVEEDMFGWMANNGLVTVRKSGIVAITPHPQTIGHHIIWVSDKLNLVIEGEDYDRLLLHLGWKRSRPAISRFAASIPPNMSFSTSGGRRDV
jgi:hypothetical protein